MEIRLKPVSPLVGLVQAISFELINLPFAGLLSPKEHIRDDRSVNPFLKGAQQFHHFSHQQLEEFHLQ